MQNKYLVPMVLKTLRILESFTQPGRELSLTEVVREAEVPKASAFRILQTLHYAGYVEKSTDNNNYRLGIKILQLCDVVDRNMELANAAMPCLLRLQREFNETANFAVLDKGDVLYLATVESTAILRMSRGDVPRESIHCTALGKAISAFLPWGTVDAVLRAKGMPRRTANTITTRTAFKRELERIRRQGAAFDNEEYETGALCVATPVFDFAGEVAGAFSISAPLSRVCGREGEVAQAVRSVAEELSRRLGFAGSYPSLAMPGSKSIGSAAAQTARSQP